MKKHRSPDHPIAFFGKVVFEFFNNEDEEFKEKSLRSITKELRKEMNVSCLYVEEHLIENPEHGSLVVAFVAPDHTKGKELEAKVLAFLDEKAPARILEEQFECTPLQRID